jgi:hypothetical protein
LFLDRDKSRATVEVVGEVGGVVPDEAEQDGTGGVLPGLSEDIEAAAAVTPRWWRSAPVRSRTLSTVIQVWSRR